MVAVIDGVASLYVKSILELSTSIPPTASCAASLKSETSAEVIELTFNPAADLDSVEPSSLTCNCPAAFPGFA